MADPLRFTVLGPVGLWRGDEPVPLGPRAAHVLARLLLARGRAVAADALVDALWPDDPPRTAANTLQVHVGHLRRALGEDRDRVRTEGPAYRLVVAEGEVDADRFEVAVRDGRAAVAEGRWAAAVQALAAGLACWQGEAWGALGSDEPFAGDAARLEELRRTVEEDAVDARLAAGEDAAVVADLEAMVRAEPYCERRVAQLMTALHRGGRSGDALKVLARTRTLLVEDLGLDPGPELVRLEGRILAGDPTLVDVPVAAPAVPVPVELPAPPSPRGRLVGRDGLAADVVGTLAAGDRLLTLHGPGGVGKTALAAEVARRHRDDGGAVAWVSLEAAAGGADAVAAVAHALGIDDVGLEPPLGAVARRLAGRPVLVVLDNGEQVADLGGAVADLLALAPGIRVLLTTRRPLRLLIERTLAVPPLATPPDPEGPDAPAPAGDDQPPAAVELFLDRLGQPLRALADRDQAAVAELCRRLDGLPLALELAAARCRTRRPSEVLADLHGGGRGAPGGEARPDLPARHQHLGAVIDGSLALLSPAARQGVPRLAALHGPAPATLAHAVLSVPLPGAVGVEDPGAALVEVAEASLGHLEVRRDATWVVLPRVVREHLAAHLPADHRRAVADRHREAVTALAEERGAAVFAAGEAMAFADLDDLLADLRGALEHALVEAPAAAVRLCLALGPWWAARGRASEGRRWTDAVLAAGGGADPALLVQAGVLASKLDDLGAAEALLDEALATLPPDHPARADAVGYRAEVAVLRGDLATAAALHAELAAWVGGAAGATGPGARFVDYLAGWLAEERGEDIAARAAFEQDLAAARSRRNATDEAYALLTLAELAVLEGDPGEAVALVGECDPDVDDPQVHAYRARVGGLLAVVQGDAGAAGARFAEAHRAALALGRRLEVSWALDGAGAAAALAGDDQRAARLFGAAAAQREAAGAAEPRPERTVLRPVREAVEQRLGPRAWDRCWQAGRALPPNRVAALVVPTTDPVAQPLR